MSVVIAGVGHVLKTRQLLKRHFCRRTVTDVLPVQDDPNCFRFGTPERNLHLRCVTAEETLEWIKSINDAKAALVGGPGASQPQSHVTQQNFT